MLLSIASVTGGGKTFSALLLARGIAGPTGKVVMIDAENGRGETYTTSKTIIEAYRDHPDGMYHYIRLDPPYSPERYTEYIKGAEDAGYTVAIVDSGSHEWDGIGGVSEMAETKEALKMGKFGRWADPKKRHRRFVNFLLTSKMHIIICLRAEPKTTQIKAGDPIVTSVGDVSQTAPLAKEAMIISRGLQPICEKKFQFEMLVSLLLEESTHEAVPIKVPEPLLPLFPGRKLITRADGEAIQRWNNDAPAIDNLERTRQRAKTAAEDGLATYSEFWKGISKEERKALAADHEVNKATAAKADAADAEIATYSNGDLPDPMSLAVGQECWHVGEKGKERLRVVAVAGDLQEWKAAV
jgi:hypothetical protein